MFGETIQRAEFRQRSQFFFRQGDPPLEIIHRMKRRALALPNELFRMLLAQSVHDTKSQPHGVIRNDRAAPFRFASRRPAASLTPCRCASFTIVAGE